MSEEIVIKKESSRDLNCPGTSGASRSRELVPKRLIFEAVEVSTWKDVLKMRKRSVMPGSGDIKHEEAEGTKLKQETLLKSIKNPKVKVKPGLALSDDTLFDRINRMACPMFEIAIPQDIRDVVVTREFLSTIYGGNSQETFPSIGKEFLARHGLNDFMYPSLDYNPAAPQIPGAPGLFLKTCGHGQEWPEVQRVITRIVPNHWQYVGQYKLSPAESLTTREWREQSELFRNTWSREVCSKGWGKDVLCRIAARRHFECQTPTQEQLDAVVQSNMHKAVTPEDVKAAFAQGLEKFAIWEMRCVGYDVDFQQNIAARFRTWQPPPRKAKKLRGKKNPAAQNVRTGRKRKRSLTSDSDSIVLNDESNYLSSS